MIQKLLIGLGALSLPLAAMAQGPNYNYAQVDWIADGEAKLETTVIDNSPVDGLALALSGDLSQFVPGLFVFGERQSIQVDEAGGVSGIHIDTASLGVGYRQDLGRILAPGVHHLDGYATLSFEEIDLLGDSAGYGVGVGLRWMVSPGLELRPEVRYIDYGSGGLVGAALQDVDGLRYGVEGVVNATDKVALTYSWTTIDLEGETAAGDKLDLELEHIIRVGARLTF